MALSEWAKNGYIDTEHMNVMRDQSVDHESKYLIVKYVFTGITGQ